MAVGAGTDAEQCMNKACPGVVLESSKQDVLSRPGAACVDAVLVDAPWARVL